MSIDERTVLARHPTLAEAEAWCDTRFASLSARALHLVGAVDGAVRLETFRGAEHIVAPIILLLGDTVIHPVNAETPELVPAAVLQFAPSGWDGRIAIAGDHPSADGQMLSANTPETQERIGIGELFKTRFEGNQLRSEVWVELKRAESVEDGPDIVRRLRANEAIEISVGAFVAAVPREGESDGRTYGAVWEAMVPDHVVLLREGLTGACSVAMGCGTPRAGVKHLMSADHTSLEMLPDEAVEQPDGKKTLKTAEAGSCSCHDKGRGAKETPVENRTLKEKFFDLFGGGQVRAAQTPAELSDDDRREILSEGLKRAESQFVRIMSVKGVEAGEVVYLVDPDPGGPAPLRPYQREFTISNEGRATFGDVRMPVRPRTEWVPIMAKGKQEPAAPADTGAERAAGAKGGPMSTHKNAERITALIGNAKSPFMADDRAYLEGLSDERLESFEKAAPAEEPAAQAADGKVAEAKTEPVKTEPKTEPARSATAESTKTTVEIEASELAELRQNATEMRAQREAKKAALVSQLKDAQSVYPEAALKLMELKQLQDVAALIGKATTEVDFSALGGPRPDGQETKVAEPPKPYDIALARRRGEQGAA